MPCEAGQVISVTDHSNAFFEISSHRLSVLTEKATPFISGLHQKLP